MLFDCCLGNRHAWLILAPYWRRIVGTLGGLSVSFSKGTMGTGRGGKNSHGKNNESSNLAFIYVDMYYICIHINILNCRLITLLITSII